LSSKLRKAKEESFFILVVWRYASLQKLLFQPWKEGHSIKDEIISLFPDFLCCNDEEFHEKIMGALVFGFFRHGMKRQVVVPDEA
jgi:hypothetical protein